jgi:hypothetical protein
MMIAATSTGLPTALTPSSPKPKNAIGRM